jgi:hypothetical protein
MLVVRQDPIELTGKVISVIPPLIGSALSPIRQWTFVVKPDAAAQAVLTTLSGFTNSDGNIECTVGVDEQVVEFSQLLDLVSTAVGNSVRLVGTWCDTDEPTRTVIHPLALLAVEHQIEIYDINGWPFAVLDFDLLAFAHAADGLAALVEPHAGESRVLTVRLPFPLRPTDTARPFKRAYESTQVNHANSATFTTIHVAGTPPELVATIDTGAPVDGKGFFATQIGLTFDEPELDSFCPPGDCDFGGKHCVHEGEDRFMYVPPLLQVAHKGDLALSPGDGVGLISGVVASLDPAQVFDHMGIFIDNGRTIRHCTSSQDRFEDEDLFTTEIVVKFVGAAAVGRQKIPLNGIRPDILRYGWPGSITQTVEEVYRTGRNSLNPQWSYAFTHPGQDIVDPERPGIAFLIYHLPRADRQRRLEFNDPERDKSESVVRLQEASVKIGNDNKEYTPMLVRPHPQFDQQVRPALHLVADMAGKINAHYRFFCYSKGDAGLDPKFIAPPSGDPGWSALPAGARWAAGTLPGMCSSFIWTAVQLANQVRPKDMLGIFLEDRADGPDVKRGLEYGIADGFYQYHEKERLAAAIGLWAKIHQKITDKFDKLIPDIVNTFTPSLKVYKKLTALRVSNQTANAFAFDACESLGDDWTLPGEGETVSPDNILDFWDLKRNAQGLFEPEGRQAIYGDSVPIILSAPQWKRVPLFRKRDIDLDTGMVTAITVVAGVNRPGVTVVFDFGCVTAVTNDDPITPFIVDLAVGFHFAEAFIVLPNPVSGNLETFRTKEPLKFLVNPVQSPLTRIELHLEPPPDLWRIVDVHLNADIHDRSFWGGDADARQFNADHDDQHIELRQDLDDDPRAPENQRNTILHAEKAWRTEPEVGSGVHVGVAMTLDLNPADRSVRCQCDVALIDTDNGGFLGIGSSVNVDQLEHRDVPIPADQTIDVLKDIDFASDEAVLERARVSLRVTNRRRPS